MGALKDSEVDSWPETSPERLRPFEETNGKWVRSQQCAKFLRRIARRHAHVAAVLDNAADEIEKNGELPDE